ncbi:unnamed protein product [Onchocerca ochengi]|uniref:Paired domain-containing protein n=1 Tax=Onchocerca ochengi TaxID=42157 RepID=A0A182E884_ONCOC|nr:unnamed protein product [Onchocerca ochengi]
MIVAGVVIVVIMVVDDNDDDNGDSGDTGDTDSGNDSSSSAQFADKRNNILTTLFVTALHTNVRITSQMLSISVKVELLCLCLRKVMSDGNKNITFTNIMGQGRVNQLGGVFINGRPLPQHIRIKIIEMASNGIKPCHISRQLRVSHGAVSKILNRYVETGSVSPGQIGGNPRSRLAIQAVEKHILALKAKCPNLCASELRSCLIEQEICSPENAPTAYSSEETQQ